jgi:chorismate lyase
VKKRFVQQRQSRSRNASWMDKPINSGAYKSWLLEQGSLTLRLQKKQANFAVQPLFVGRAKIAKNEVQCFSRRQQTAIKRGYAGVRDVILQLNQEPVVFAHSVMAISAKTNTWRGMHNLGNRSLGTRLFADPKVMRGLMQYKKLAINDRLWRLARQHLTPAKRQDMPNLWARRSVFILGSSAILVNEIFLPKIL